MKDDSLIQLGAACALVASAVYFIAGLLFVLLPAEQKSMNDLAQFLPSFAQNPSTYLLFAGALALAGLLSIIASRAVLEVMRPLSDGWVISMTYVAIFGFALMVIDAFRTLSLLPGIAAAYVAGGDATKAAIAATGSMLSLDPVGMLTLGGVGLWVLVLSVLILRRSSVSRGLAIAGIILTLLNWLQVVGAISGITVVVSTAASLDYIVAIPLWFFWMGLTLRRSLSPSWNVQATLAD